MYTYDDFLNICIICKSYCEKYDSKNIFIVDFINNPTIKLDYVYDSIELDIIGLYYQHIEKDYNLMKKYYLMAIDEDNDMAMNNLGYYYKYIEKDYNLMKKYYLMAIDKGNDISMNNLGCYYFEIEKDYELMKKYYFMTISKDNSLAMYNLAFYYQLIEKDYNLMKKYYLMAVSEGNLDAMNNLGYYYEKIEKDHEQAKKYYLMAISKGDSDAMNNLVDYYKNNLFELYLLLNSIEDKNLIIIDKIKNLKKTNKDIIYFENKVKLFSKLNNYSKCPLCLNDDVLNIDLSCGHEICIDCYRPQLKCYYQFCNCL